MLRNFKKFINYKKHHELKFKSRKNKNGEGKTKTKIIEKGRK